MPLKQGFSAVFLNGRVVTQKWVVKLYWWVDSYIEDIKINIYIYKENVGNLLLQEAW